MEWAYLRTGAIAHQSAINGVDSKPVLVCNSLDGLGGLLPAGPSRKEECKYYYENNMVRPTRV